MKRTTLAILLATFIPALLHAHPGAGPVHGFDHGFVHPIGGLDHVVAMLAVGLWAVQLGGRARWIIPATFAGVMTLGGIAGMQGIEFGFVEQGVLASVLVLGVFIAAAWRMPLGASAVLVGLFALCHGLAHGIEMPAGSSGLAYALGFGSATVLLHAAGIGLGLLMRRLARPLWVRAAGALCALAGLMLIVG
jgi:urease accessory protein